MRGECPYETRPPGARGPVEEDRLLYSKLRMPYREHRE